MKKDTQNPTEPEPIPAAEWAVAWLGLALLCTCIGLLLYKAFFVDNGVPEISFTVEQLVPQDSGALMLATVSNSGGKTVTDLHIIGTSGSERHEIEVDFLPARSSRKFGMFFTRIPSPDSIKLIPGGYQEP